MTIIATGGFPDDGQCGASEDGVRCTRPGSQRLAFGCEHEHVEEADFCDQHAGELRLMVRWQAAACLDCGGHTCRLQVMAVAR